MTEAVHEKTGFGFYTVPGLSIRIGSLSRMLRAH
jgi:hypothetical protein